MAIPRANNRKAKADRIKTAIKLLDDNGFMVVSPSKVRELKDEAARKATTKVFLLMMAVFVDKLHIYDEDTIFGIYNSVTIWAEAIDDHRLEIEFVQDLIKRKRASSSMDGNLMNNKRKDVKYETDN